MQKNIFLFKSSFLGMAILVASISSVLTASAEQPYTIAVSQRISDAFPNIESFLKILNQSSEKVLSFESQSVSLEQAIIQQFKDIDVVVALASEAPQILPSHVKQVPGRRLKSTYFAISEEDSPLSNLQNASIYYPDLTDFRRFTTKVVDSCLFKYTSATTTNKLIPFDLSNIGEDDINDFIIRSYMDKRYVAYQNDLYNVLWDIRNENMRFAQLFSQEDEKESFKKCLESAGGAYHFEEAEISNFDELNQIFEMIYQQSGNSILKLHGVVEYDQVILYMNRNSYDDFSAKFGRFVDDNYGQFRRNYPRDNLSDTVRDLLLSYAEAYNLISDDDNVRGVVEYANLKFYEPARRAWYDLRRGTIQKYLSEKKQLERSDRLLIESAVQNLLGYFDEIDEIGWRRVEQERLVGLRMLAIYQAFLHQDAYNASMVTDHEYQSKWKQKSGEWLRACHNTIDRYFEALDDVEQHGDNYLELRKTDLYDGELNLWKPRLEEIRRIPE